MGKDRLKRLIVEGIIIGFQDPQDHDKWIIDRRSLDAYREGQINELEHKAAAIFQKAASKWFQISCLKDLWN